MYPASQVLFRVCRELFRPLRFFLRQNEMGAAIIVVTTEAISLIIGIKSITQVYFLGALVLIPSMCSNRSSLIGARIGSKMKSIPSRRACFAAGTKSLSPEIKTI